MAKQKAGMVKWDEKFAALAGRAAKAVAGVSGGSMVSHKGGILSYKGAAMPDNKMEVVIILDITHNAFYEGRYDSDNPQSPVCFAFGDVTGEDENFVMAPHPDSSSPQADQCQGCPQNEWGSADQGRGKACKNMHRIAMITGGDLEDIAAAEVAYMHIPVMSVKGWAGYVRQLQTVEGKPPLAFVTTVSCVPDAKSQYRVVFGDPQVIEDNEQLEQLLAKMETAQQEIAFPYAQIEAPAPPQRNTRQVQGGARGGGKTAAVAARTAATQRKSATLPAVRGSKFAAKR